MLISKTVSFQPRSTTVKKLDTTVQFFDTATIQQYHTFQSQNIPPIPFPIPAQPRSRTQNTCATAAQPFCNLSRTCATVAQPHRNPVLHLCNNGTIPSQPCFIPVQQRHNRITPCFMPVPPLHNHFAGLRCLCAAI